MKIAVLHNFLDNVGGAEIVTLVLARELKADVYTTNIDRDKIKAMGFKDILPRMKSLGRIPLNAPFRHQLALKKFRKLKLEGYDFHLISGDWTVSGAINNKPNLYYCHTPPRELWDLRKYVRSKIVKWWQRPLFDIWVFFNRHLFKKYIKEVQKIACNSQNTQKRISKYYNKKAKVIYPPVDVRKYQHKKGRDYWFSVNRLFPHKRIELQLKAFSKLPKENLIIVGSYEKSKHFLQYVDYCKKIKPDNVEIKSWISQTELIDLYANCKGFITTAMDEDFGINAVEAMASGKPVIAPNEGGYKETVISGKTGMLIDNMNEEKLIEAIKRFSIELNKDPNKYKDACIKRAKKFDIEEFIKKIKDEIKKYKRLPIQK